jgi:hypothetical protein
MYPFFSCEYILPKEGIRIKKEEVLKLLQVPLNEADTYTLELIQEYAGLALKICSPRARYVIYENPDFKDPVEMKLEGFDFHLDKIVSASLKKSSHLAVFVATTGNEVEKLSKELILEGHFLEGVIVDILGSEIAEESARQIYEIIREEMAQKGFYITNRYSPGYCNWPVSDQQHLFSLLGKDTCGVQLTESSLMLPIKSVSGIVGVGKKVKFQDYFCDKCKIGSCIYRDTKQPV